MANVDLTIPANLDRTGSLPAMVEKAASTLASAKSAAEVLDARDMATVAYDTAKSAARFARAKGAHDELLSKIHRAQADALDIEARAKRRLADEYDAAQERGEIGSHGGDRTKFQDQKLAKATEVIPPKELHEARILRDAEKTDPGITKRTIDAAVKAGEEPTRATVRRAALRTVKPDTAPIPIRPTRGKSAIALRAREAITALSGLPPASEVVAFMRGTDDAVLVDEALPSAARWLAEFSDLWGDE